MQCGTAGTTIIRDYAIYPTILIIERGDLSVGFDSNGVEDLKSQSNSFRNMGFMGKAPS
jgi:hypothetical protein